MKARLFLGGAIFCALMCAGFVWRMRGSSSSVAGPQPRASSPPYLTIFLVDGLQQRVFQEQLSHLPEMRRLIDEGAYIENGVTSFPSVSGYAYYPFLTGVPAAHSGVAGLRWFDRSRSQGNFRNYIGATSVHLNRDLAREVPTVFELVGDSYTSSTNTFVNRGAKKVISDGLGYVISTYGSAYSKGVREAMQVAIDDLPARPKVQWVTLPHLDAVFHFEGPCPAYQELLFLTDSLIGTYRAASRAAGTEDDRIYAVVSDHGGAAVNRHFDVAQYLDRLGIPVDRDQAVHLFDSTLNLPLSKYDTRSAIVAVNGNLMSHVYLRKPGLAGAAGWRIAPTRAELSAYPSTQGAIDLVGRFRAQPGIGLVVVREGEHRIGLYEAHGAAEITVLGNRYAYRVVRGNDPLGYRGRLVGTGPHSAHEWLAATYLTRYPDAVPQLGSFMSEPGPGDLVLIAAPDYDLAQDFEPVVGNFRGGHGGIDAAQFRVPFILSGPGIRHTRLEFARAEDVGATLQALLQVRGRHPPEGEVLPILSR